MEQTDWQPFFDAFRVVPTWLWVVTGMVMVTAMLKVLVNGGCALVDWVKGTHLAVRPEVVDLIRGLRSDAGVVSLRGSGGGRVTLPNGVAVDAGTGGMLLDVKLPNGNFVDRHFNRRERGLVHHAFCLRIKAETRRTQENAWQAFQRHMTPSR